MKRNLDLIRNILLTIEETEANNPLSVQSFVNDEYDEHAISLHIKLLLDCGYIEASPFRYIGMQYDDFRILRITSSGYDYLDSVRNDTVWTKTKEKISEVGESVSLDLVKKIASSAILAMLGI